MDLLMARLLKAAADPTRLRLLNLLCQGTLCVCDLQAVLRIPQPTVSRHLGWLRNAGLVWDLREGTRMYYSLAPPDTPQRQALFRMLRELRPHEPRLIRDVADLEEATRQGRCRLQVATPPMEAPGRQADTRAASASRRDAARCGSPWPRKRRSRHVGRASGKGVKRGGASGAKGAHS